MLRAAPESIQSGGHSGPMKWCIILDVDQVQASHELFFLFCRIVFYRIVFHRTSQGQYSFLSPPPVI